METSVTYIFSSNNLVVLMTSPKPTKFLHHNKYSPNCTAVNGTFKCMFEEERFLQDVEL